MSALVSYDVGSSDDDDQTEEHALPPTFETSRALVNAAPMVDETMVKLGGRAMLDIDECTELKFNPRYEDLYAPKLGPIDPKKPVELFKKNFLTGRLEPTNIADTTFEEQRKAHHAWQLANVAIEPVKITDAEVGDEIKLTEKKEKRKRLVNSDPGDIDGYTGPWAEYENEQKIAKPTEEEAIELVDILAKQRAKSKKFKEAKVEEEFKETVTFHIEDRVDYQGRSFIYPPHDVEVPLHKYDHAPNRCFLPKKLLHTYTGHTKPITAIRLYPVSGHLILSSSMDTKIKLWEAYHERRCIYTIHGHKQAVRDICFNRKGDRFVSAGYDRTLKLWNTETGECIKRLNSRKVAYCIKFNISDEAHSHFLLSGMSDKKILCWDTRSGKVCQEYDRHLGAVSTVTFVDNGRKFVSTSDDKSLRVWEWDIPVDVKYIADPSMHAIPAVTAAPNGKWLACQSMDNKIQAFTCMNRYKLNHKKIFTGHMVAGYACQPEFSPDMSYLISGDADGKVFFWDWKTTKLLSSFQAHDNVCIAACWLPHETSKLVTAGWDNNLKLWD